MLRVVIYSLLAAIITGYVHSTDDQYQHMIRTSHAVFGPVIMFRSLSGRSLGDSVMKMNSYSHSIAHTLAWLPASPSSPLPGPPCPLRNVSLHPLFSEWNILQFSIPRPWLFPSLPLLYIIFSDQLLKQGCVHVSSEHEIWHGSSP